MTKTSKWANVQEYQDFIESIPLGWKHRVKDRVTQYDFYTHPQSGDTRWVEFVQPLDENPPHLVYCSSCGVDGSLRRDRSEL